MHGRPWKVKYFCEDGDGDGDECTPLTLNYNPLRSSMLQVHDQSESMRKIQLGQYTTYSSNMLRNVTMCTCIALQDLIRALFLQVAFLCALSEWYITHRLLKHMQNKTDTSTSELTHQKVKATPRNLDSHCAPNLNTCPKQIRKTNAWSPTMHFPRNEKPFETNYQHKYQTNDIQNSWSYFEHVWKCTRIGMERASGTTLKHMRVLHFWEMC